MTDQMFMQAGVSVLALIVYFVLVSFSRYVIKSFGRKQNIHKKRIVYTNKSVAALLLIVLLNALIIIWGIDLRNILIFVSSFFAVIGIALFASWSVLSNVTAGVIIFFSFPYKIGDSIKIVDGENSIEGKITDMTLFHIKVKEIEGNVILYPNNLAIQKPIILNREFQKAADIKPV
jgi:small-conductance mechanosensitive channel